MARREEKILFVLDWLLEFRFSSLPLLSQRIDQPLANTRKFFNDLLDAGLIQAFKNVHTKNQRYVLLKKAGVSYLEGHGRDVSGATTRIQHLGKYGRVIHDLSVQHAVLSRLDKFQEVIWDSRINKDDYVERPDAILVTEKGIRIALEYERWRKDRKRIFLIYESHLKAIRDKKFSGVYYDFYSPADVAFYRQLFLHGESKPDIDDMLPENDYSSSSVYWPQYIREKKSGRVLETKRMVRPFDYGVKNLDKIVSFAHNPFE